MAMIPFDTRQAIAGTILRGIDASTLLAGREPLEQWRIDIQHKLIATKTPRWDMIEVNLLGVILNGNHGARAAAEAHMPVDIIVVDFPQPSHGPTIQVKVIP
jgi:hypothetical protein